MPRALTYLDRLRSQYTENRGSADTLLQTAADAGRELTEDEARTFEQYERELTRLEPLIEAHSSRQERDRRMERLVGDVDEDIDEDDRQERSRDDDREERADGSSGRRRSSTRAQDRDPGHYRSAKDGGRNSFFHDIVHARPEVSDDTAARTRLAEHSRALSTGVAGAGLVPPKWLTDMYAPLARQGRVVTNAVRHIDLGDDPRPVTLPKQTTGTDAVVAEQATENTHPSETDAFATDVDTVTFKPTSGIQVVSRQTIDMTDPSIDELIYGDMLSVYDRKCEDKVVAAMVAAATAAATTVTFATEAAFADTDPVPVALDAIIDNEFAVWNNREEPPDIHVMRIRRWQAFRKLRDLDGRALIPPEFTRQQMVNIEGVGTINARGMIEDCIVLPSKGLGTTAYPESILTARASDTIFWEGAVQRFRFEEVAGPESIKLGIWAYTGVLVRYAASSVRRIVITAAT